MANNENLIPIPGRLHSVATEGHVAGADEIYDDSLQKDQATINQEVQEAIGTEGSVDSRIAAAVNVEKTRAERAESTLTTNLGNEVTRATNAENALDGRVDTLEEAVGTGGSVDSRISTAVNAAKSEIKGNATSACDTLGEAEALISAEATRAQAAEADRYTKSETYTKEEVHNLITTPSQEYVSVTATDQTTAATDVLPATGSADTVYRVGNWNGTQYSEVDYTEYAWNGSAYVKLSVKSQVGEVYDISADHADTKYADLVAALGTNGANIPQSLRRGGMSVKFVQSSDNKYVQFRLTHPLDNASTATADFLNTDNWQQETEVSISDSTNTGGQNLYINGEKVASVDNYLNLETYYNVTNAFSSSEAARTAVPQKKRCKGMIISYRLNGGWISERHISATLSNWEADSNWQQIGYPTVINCFAGWDAQAISTGKITGVGDKYFNTGNKRIYVCVTYTDSTHMTFDSIGYPTKESIYIYDNNLYIYNGTTLVKTNDYDTSISLLRNSKTILLKCFANSDSAAISSGKITGVGDKYYNTNDKHLYTCVTYTDATHMTFLREDGSPSAESIYMLDDSLYHYDGTNMAMFVLNDITDLEHYIRISSRKVITQNNLNGWENCCVEIIGDVVFSGNSDYIIPSSAILFFNGGHFISESFNGSVNANGAFVKASPYTIFDKNLQFTNSFTADVSFAEWFGAKGNNEQCDAIYFNKLIEHTRCNEIHLVADKTYVLEADIILDNATLRGTQTSKLVRYPVFVELPITTEITENIIATNGQITINVDTTSEYYASLKVGMAVNIVPLSTSIKYGNEFKNRRVISINNGVITLDGGDFVKMANSSYYAIINEYQLLNMRRNAKVFSVNFDGRLDVIPYNRGYWRLGATIGAGIQDYIQPSGASQTFGYVIEDCIIDNSVADGVEMLGVHGVLKHNIIRHCGGNCVHFSMCDDVNVENNFLFDANINPLTEHNEGAITYSMCIRNVFIINNYIDTCDVGIQAGGITTCKSIYSNNTICNFRTHGIDFRPLNGGTQYGSVIKDYIISGNRFVATNDYSEGTYNWEQRLEDSPIVPRRTATGKGINTVKSEDVSRVKNVIITDNMFVDCGAFLKGFDDFIFSNNNITISHQYSNTETKPSNLLGFDDSKGNVSSNILKNNSSDAVNNIIDINRSKILVGLNMYKTITGDFISISQDSTVEQFGNANLD